MPLCPSGHALGGARSMLCCAALCVSQVAWLNAEVIAAEMLALVQVGKPSCFCLGHVKACLCLALRCAGPTHVLTLALLVVMSAHWSLLCACQPLTGAAGTCCAPY